MGQPEAGGHAAPAQRARVRGQLRDRPPDGLQLPRADQREAGGPRPQADQLAQPLVQLVADVEDGSVDTAAVGIAVAAVVLLLLGGDDEALYGLDPGPHQGEAGARQQVDEAAPVLGRGHARVLGHEVDTLEIR